MKKEVSQNYKMFEYEMFDGESFITFNIVEVNEDKRVVILAITKEGKISVCTYDLISEDGRFYFEYGVMCEKIAINDFVDMED